MHKSSIKHPLFIFESLTSKINHQLEPYQTKKNVTFYIESIQTILEYLKRIIELQHSDTYELTHPVDSNLNISYLKQYDLSSEEAMLDLKIQCVYQKSNVELLSLRKWLALLQQFYQHQQWLNDIRREVKLLTDKSPAYGDDIHTIIKHIEDVINLSGKNRGHHHHFHSESYHSKSIGKYTLQCKNDLVTLEIKMVSNDGQIQSLPPLQQYLERLKRQIRHTNIEKKVLNDIELLKVDSPFMLPIVTQLKAALWRLKKTVSIVNNDTQPPSAQHTPQFNQDYIRNYDLSSEAAMYELAIETYEIPTIEPQNKSPAYSPKASLSDQASNIKKNKPEVPFLDFSFTEATSLLRNLSEGQNLSNPFSCKLPVAADTENKQERRLTKYSNPSSPTGSLPHRGHPSEKSRDIHREKRSNPSLATLLEQLKRPRTARCLFNIIYEQAMPEVCSLQERAAKEAPSSRAHTLFNTCADNIAHALHRLRLAIYLKYSLSLSQAEEYKFIRKNEVDATDFSSISELLGLKITTYSEGETSVNMSLGDALNEAAALKGSSDIARKLLTMDIPNALKMRFTNTISMHDKMFSSVITARNLCELAEVGYLQDIKNIKPSAADIDLLIEASLPPMTSLTGLYQGVLSFFQQPKKLYVGRYNALIIAVLYQHEKIVKYFIRHGADPTIKGGRANDISALDCAQSILALNTKFGADTRAISNIIDCLTRPASISHSDNSSNHSSEPHILHLGHT